MNFVFPLKTRGYYGTGNGLKKMFRTFGPVNERTSGPDDKLTLGQDHHCVLRTGGPSVRIVLKVMCMIDLYNRSDDIQSLALITSFTGLEVL